MKKNNKRVLFFAVLISLLLISCIVSAAETESEIKGKLVIVGGALQASTSEIFEKFIELAGGKNAKVGIIPTASGKLTSSQTFAKNLQKLGIKPENIIILPISKHDFANTTENEAITWKNNENSDGLVNQIKELNAVWFVGGDQTLICQALLNADDTNSKALDAIWEIYRSGAVLGGSSAGAAIMSNPMIAGGDSFGALTKGVNYQYNETDDQECAPLCLQKGLGFFADGIVDQHHDKKSRLVRTVVAALEGDMQKKYAYGIDENTAMIVDNSNKSFTILGKGYVTVIDLAAAKVKGTIPNVSISDVSFSLLDKGDSYSFATHQAVINNKKNITTGNEYFNFTPRFNSGAFTPYNKLKDFVFYTLIDNRKVQEVNTFCFDENGLGYRIVLKKGCNTIGYSTTSDDVDDYSAVNVLLDIKPIKVEISDKY